MSSHVVTGWFMSRAFSSISLSWVHYIHNKFRFIINQLKYRMSLSIVCLPAHIYGGWGFQSSLLRWFLRAMPPSVRAYCFGTVRVVPVSCWSSPFHVRAYYYMHHVSTSGSRFMFKQLWHLHCLRRARSWQNPHGPSAAISMPRVLLGHAELHIRKHT